MNSTPVTETSEGNGKAYTQQERKELAQLARGLRRMKRQLFLKQVEEPQDSVTCLRELLIRAASQNSSSRSMSSSLRSHSQSSQSFDLSLSSVSELGSVP